MTHWNPYKGEKTTLVEGKDYRLEYSDNTEIGTAKVKVIGLGDYEGYEKILSFEIKAPHGWNGFQVNYNGDVYKDGDDLGSFDWEKGESDQRSRFLVLMILIVKELKMEKIIPSLM